MPQKAEWDYDSAEEQAESQQGTAQYKTADIARRFLTKGIISGTTDVDLSPEAFAAQERAKADAEAMKLFEAKGVTAPDPADKERIIQSLLRRYKRNEPYSLEAAPAGYLAGISEGVHADQNTAVLEPEQRQAIMQQQKWSQNPDQAAYRVASRIATEKRYGSNTSAVVNAIIFNDADTLKKIAPDALAELDAELMPRYGSPAVPERPWVDTLSGITTSAAGGAVKFAKQSLAGNADINGNNSMWDFAKAIPDALVGAREGALGYHMGEDQYLPKNVMRDTFEATRREADQEVGVENPYAPPERRAELVARKVQEKLGKDLLGPLIENPNFTQGAADVLLDPTMYVPGVNIGVGAAKLAKLAPTLAKGVAKVGVLAEHAMAPVKEGMEAIKATNIAGELSKIFSHAPGSKLLRNKQLGRELRAAVDKGEAVDRVFSPEQLNKAAKIDELVGENKALFWDVMDGKVPLEYALKDIPPSAREDFFAAHTLGQEINEASREFAHKTNTWRTLNEDQTQWIEPDTLEHYAPHRIRDRTANPNEFTGREVNRDMRYNEPTPGASYQRVEFDSDVFHPKKDFALQTAANVHELGFTAKNTTKLKEIHEALVRNKSLRSATNRKRADQIVEQLNAVSGGERYVVMTGEVNSAYNKALKTVGSKNTGTYFIVPKHAATLIETIAKRNLPGVGSSAAALEMYKSFRTNFYRPLTSVWKMARVLPRIGHYTEDALSSAMYTYTGVGIKGFELEKQKAALTTAVAVAWDNAAVGGKWAKKAQAALPDLKLKLSGGEEITAEQLVKIMSEHGALDGFRERIGVEARDRSFFETGKLGERVGSSMHRLQANTEKLLSQGMRANQAIDTYHHTALFASALKDTTPAGIANALELMHDYAPAYNRMSVAQKEFLRDGLGFAGFLQFSLANHVKSIMQHPDRVARLEHITNAIGASQKDRYAVSGKGVQPYANLGFPAPDFLQSQRLEKWAENPETIPEPGSEEYMQLTIQTPSNVALSYVKNIIGTSKDKNRNLALLSALPKYAFEMLAGEDAATGEGFGEFGRVGGSTMNFALGFVPAGIKLGAASGGIDALADILQAHGKSEEAVNMRLWALAYNFFVGAGRADVVDPYKGVQEQSEKALQHSKETVKMNIKSPF